MCEEWDLADAYTLVDYMRGLGLRTIVLPSSKREKWCQSPKVYVTAPCTLAREIVLPGASQWSGSTEWRCSVPHRPVGNDVSVQGDRQCDGRCADTVARPIT